MFRTRLAALIVAGSLSFTSGCMGFSNMFCNRSGRLLFQPAVLFRRPAGTVLWRAAISVPVRPR